LGDPEKYRRKHEIEKCAHREQKKKSALTASRKRNPKTILTQVSNKNRKANLLRMGSFSKKETSGSVSFASSGNNVILLGSIYLGGFVDIRYVS